MREAFLGGFFGTLCAVIGLVSIGYFWAKSMEQAESEENERKTVSEPRVTPELDMVAINIREMLGKLKDQTIAPTVRERVLETYRSGDLKKMHVIERRVSDLLAIQQSQQKGA